MSQWEQYLLSISVEEALEALTGSGGSSAIIAGGTDLLIDMRQGRHEPVRTLIDISRIPELQEIQISNRAVQIGAGVTHSRIAEHPDLQQHARCLVIACESIGGPQVRNVATIGGNVAHALPAGDGTIALLALDAEAELATPGGRSWIRLEKLFKGPGETTFARDQAIITRFRFNTAQPLQGSSFQRVMRPQGVAIAILNMAILVQLSEHEHIERIHIAAGPGGPVPFRARKTEAELIGQPITPELFRRGADLLLDEISLRTSPHRASQEYRRHIARMLFEQTLQDALEDVDASG